MNTLMAASWALFMASAWGEAPRVAVYESEANYAQYQGLHQMPLRTWLRERGQEFSVIGDEVAADPARLADFAVVMTTSTYLIPREACDGLRKYLARGGCVVWIDSPSRCSDPSFRQTLGLGPNSTYAPMRSCRIAALVPNHPCAGTVEEIEAASLVGNPALTATPDAQVLYEISGSLGGQPVRFPAVILAHHGLGTSLCYNWILWLGGARESESLLSDGLDYLLALHQTRTRPVAVFCTVSRRVVRQPDAIPVVCKLFARGPAAATPAHWSVSLVSAEGAVVRGPVRTGAQWTWAENDLGAALARIELPTDALGDGDYQVSSEVVAGETCVRAQPVPVTLTGDMWAALQRGQTERRKQLEPLLSGTRGDYDLEPRTPEGRVDIPRLLEQITAAHMNMYDWLIWHAPTDWEDLQQFLPLAREQGIKVWVTLCPPSEQGGRFPWSEPFRLDFLKWADEIGKLSTAYNNLVALVIDDFASGSNQRLFTPDYIARLVSILRHHNPSLAFLPTLYWDSVGDAHFMEEYGPAIDGIVFPYTELETGDDLENQLRACRAWLGPDKFVMVNVYASGSGGGPEPGPRSPEYLRRTLTLSRQLADGVRIYCLPKNQLGADYRFAIVAELYGQWAGEE